MFKLICLVVVMTVVINMNTVDGMRKQQKEQKSNVNYIVIKKSTGCKTKNCENSGCKSGNCENTGYKKSRSDSDEWDRYSDRGSRRHSSHKSKSKSKRNWNSCKCDCSRCPPPYPPYPPYPNMMPPTMMPPNMMSSTMPPNMNTMSTNMNTMAPNMSTMAPNMSTGTSTVSTTTMAPPSCPRGTIAANVTALNIVNIQAVANLINVLGNLVAVCLNASLLTNDQIANLNASGQLINNLLNLNLTSGNVPIIGGL